ncbi:fimbrial protein, partial [Acinetobacter baumannii]
MKEKLLKLDEPDLSEPFLRFVFKTKGEFKHEVRQFEKSYDNQQAEQISLMV